MTIHKGQVLAFLAIVAFSCLSACSHNVKNSSLQPASSASSTLIAGVWKGYAPSLKGYMLVLSFEPKSSMSNVLGIGQEVYDVVEQSAYAKDKRYDFLVIKAGSRNFSYNYVFLRNSQHQWERMGNDPELSDRVMKAMGLVRLGSP